jgi:hypothetical protein
MLWTCGGSPARMVGWCREVRQWAGTSAVTLPAAAPGAAKAAVWALALVRVPAEATAVAAGVPAAPVAVWAAAMAAAPGAPAAVVAEVAKVGDAVPAAALLVRVAPALAVAAPAEQQGLHCRGAGLRRGTERVQGVAMPSDASLR